ncbi:MAG: AarF/UbiB family protein [Rhodospirillales bacterium]|nr:AarF/UbiB family protein [Rhodospirillales bacterium]
MDGSDDGEWDAFCDGLDVASLVPETLARYRPAVLAGLEHFLANLPPERALQILAAQADLPDDADIGTRLIEIAHVCPALHKLGQVMARDRRLPAALRHLLQRLETVPCRLPEAELRTVVERELGSLDGRGITLDGPALAEASVAIVIPYRWPRAEDGVAERGVFKVLKPGIEAILEEELELLQGVGLLLDEQCHALGVPEIAYADTFAQVRTLLAREVHLNDEQAHLATAARLYAGNPAVVVPALHPFCGPRITSMARIDGRKVTDVSDLPAMARRRLAASVVQALIARPIWPDDGDSLFHADPHAGNLMLTNDGRLAILDWSLVGTLAKDEQVQLTQIVLGAFALDNSRIAAAIDALSDGAVDNAAMRRIIDVALTRLATGALPGLDWLTELMDAVVMEAGGRFSPNLIIFRKVLQTLRGVIADIAEDCPVDGVLLAAFLKRFGSEWPSRWLSGPFSRGVTHVSNADLAQLAMSVTLGAARLWLDWQRAWLTPPPKR